jgi:alpha-2-macroglobulin
VLSVSLGVADEIRPRGPMEIPVTIGNLEAGKPAFVTVAAVDVGILNLTQFKAPAPDDWYFGQRRLGIEIRDLYGLLIDRMQGEPGAIRSGGDGGPGRLQAPPPTQKLLAFYSGIVEVDGEGKTSISFDLPEFNGSVRVMAMAWTADAVGHAAKDVIVRDPVVVAASVPRFLATGDNSRLLVEINNVAGAAGDYRLTIDAEDGVTIASEDSERTITLAAEQRTSIIVPISGALPGDHEIHVTLAPPSGEAFPMDLLLGVRPPGADVTRRNVVAVNGGGRLTIGADTLAEFVPGTTSVTVSLGGAGRLDVAGILAALDRYPYGCAEQLTSRALPLVYLDEVAASIGIADDKEVRERVQEAIAGVLAKQTSAGGFGLWGPYDGGDLWLDAYVTDFLTRAAERGYDVPETARNIAFDNLSNRLAYAQDFTNGGEDVAYALYVLARAGRAAIGDLRYYAESKLDAFRTPLAKAQIGAALALYGDRRRTDAAFAAALADLDRERDDPNVWRVDYGTKLRDQAAVLALAAETKAERVDLRELATRIATAAEGKRWTSTQEQSWMMLAAAALIRDAAQSKFSVDGETVDGPLYREFEGLQIASSPVVVENLGSETLDAVVAATGVPVVPEPAGGNGYTIAREVYTPEGEPADLATVGQNDRFVVVVKVTGDRARAGRLLVVDPIPAGFEIENPNLSASGATTGYDWLSVDNTAVHTEARTDRFVAALNREESDALEFSVAYTMRAVSPGTFAQPGATVEDMYRPELFARSASGRVEVVGPLR